jgi:hypothetical protein
MKREIPEPLATAFIVLAIMFLAIIAIILAVSDIPK